MKAWTKIGRFLLDPESSQQQSGILIPETISAIRCNQIRCNQSGAKESMPGRNPRVGRAAPHNPLRIVFARWTCS